MSYYGIKQDLLKSGHTYKLDICECQLLCLHLEDFAYYHNKTYLVDQSMSVASNPPCIFRPASDNWFKACSRCSRCLLKSVIDIISKSSRYALANSNPTISLLIFSWKMS